jgi:hypothetical protein
MRGRPFQPGNQFGRGRPKGSRNKQSLAVRRLLDENGPKLLLKAMSEAAKGNVPLLRMFAQHELDGAKECVPPIGSLAIGTPEELKHSQQIVMNQVTAGGLASAQGARLLDMLELRRKGLETHDLAEQMDALEREPIS